MDQLGLYALSVILSYLNEVEGTRLLLTKKLFSKAVLPLFRLRSASSFNCARHKFVVAPVQDATVLLERLNTRRLFRRRDRPTPNYTTWELAHLEWVDAVLNRDKHKNISNPDVQGQPLRPPKLELLRLCKYPSVANNSVAMPNVDDEMWKKGVTLLASYPRSGNTLVRTLLERVTGLVTGSDTRPDRPLSRALSIQYGLVGEGVTNGSTVRVVKTHWPERRGCANVKAQRVILLVRNPFDVIDSYWNMNATNTHNQTVTDDVYERFQSVFEGLVRNEMKIWKWFIEYWCGSTTTGPIMTCNSRVPILLVRFEDLILDPAAQMQRIMQFLLCKPLSEFWLERIQLVTRGPLANLGSYQPRSASNIEHGQSGKSGGDIRHDAAASIGKALRKKRYSAEVLQYMHSAAASNPGQTSLLQLFGYDIYHQGFPNNFAEGSVPPLPSVSALLQTLLSTNTLNGRHTVKPSALINQGDEIRPLLCPYGRAMRQWRWKETDQDKRPFPTVQRLPVPEE